MEDNEWLPRVSESMEEYLSSDRYHQHSKTITFSDFESQEEENYIFWRSLTPRQRLELHHLMIEAIYQDKTGQSSIDNSKNIVFTELSL